MSADHELTADHEVVAAADTNPVSTLARWISTLAKDVDAVVATCAQLAPAAPLRAPLRAGLRHLVHIFPLAEGIEALAMLEVALVLRVTALLAQPAEELGDETVLRLRAETGLIEELFPAEREALWRLGTSLIEKESALECAVAESEPDTTETRDVLLERAIEWTSTYTAPAFGGNHQELVRAQAFVKNRAVAWST